MKPLSMLHAAIAAGVENYSERKVLDLRVHPDPEVERTYAVRAKLEGLAEHVDFLLIAGDLKGSVLRASPEEIGDRLEEAVFARNVWPPLRRGEKV